MAPEISLVTEEERGPVFFVLNDDKHGGHWLHPHTKYVVQKNDRDEIQQIARKLKISITELVKRLKTGETISHKS